MTPLDPLIEFEYVIKRLEYPNSRAEIIDAVRTHGSTGAVVTIAESLPHKSYANVTEVMSAVPESKS